MRSRKASRRRSRPVEIDVRDPSEVDPLRYAEDRPRGARSARKAWQLARQVEEALRLYLAGDCEDEEVSILDVLAVEPAPDSSRLMVSLWLPADAPEDIARRLSDLAPDIRTEIAAAIHRHRVPELVYRLERAPRPGPSESDGPRAPGG